MKIKIADPPDGVLIDFRAALGSMSRFVCCSPSRRNRAFAARPRTSPLAVIGLMIVLAVILAVPPAAGAGPAQADFKPYIGQTPPGATPQVFAPGIVSTDAHEFSCSMTPDGNLMYFTWNKPVPGQEGPPMNIWCSGRTEGGWSKPFNPGGFLNPNKAMFVTTTLDGTIYTTDISGGPAGTAVAVARIADGQYEALNRLPAPINVDAQDMYPYVAPDESYLVFQSRRTPPTPSSGLFVSFRNPDGSWGDPRAIDLGGLQGGLPFVSPDGKYLFFTAGERGKSDIYWVEARFLQDRAPAQYRPAATAATAAAAPAQTAAASAAPAEMPHFELMTLVAEGRRLHANLYGKGKPTVVLVSGFNAPQEYWSAIVDPLAAEATVVTYDRAGVGKSELGTLPAHARQSAADLRRLLAALQAPKPWLLVGHSLGARIVKIFASMYPEEAGGLVLMDGVPANIIEEQKKILGGADLELLERMTSGQAAQANPRVEADFSLVSLEQEQTMGPLPRVPILVLIAGDREKNVPPGFSPEARKKIAQLGMDLQKQMAADLGGTFIVFEGVGHGLHTETPGPVADAIKDMIRKIK